MTDSNKKFRRLQSLIDGLSEPLVSASDEEIYDQINEEGLDVKKLGNLGRQILGKALEVHKSNALKQARIQYQVRLAAFHATNFFLPTSFEEKLKLLKECLEKHAFVKDAVLTTQHRDFKNLSEADLDSMLRQLHTLGLLANSSPVIKKD